MTVIVLEGDPDAVTVEAYIVVAAPAPPRTIPELVGDGDADADGAAVDGSGFPDDVTICVVLVTARTPEGAAKDVVAATD